jgi:hypothetical protein
MMHNAGAMVTTDIGRAIGTARDVDSRAYSTRLG